MKWVLGLLLVAMFAGCVEEEPVLVLPKPFAVEHEISWTPSLPVPGDEVIFTLTTNIQPSELQWRYGDGTSGSKATHVYRTSGEFQVSAEYLTTEGMQAANANLTVQGLSPAKPVEPEPEVVQVPIDQAPFQFSVNGNRVSLHATEPFTINEVQWGDGAENQESSHTYAYNGNWTISVRFNDLYRTEAHVATKGFIPHVVVGVADSGFNVYHEVYRRPHLTEHPCTYIENYRCEVPALRLTFDAPTWQEAFEADREIWDAISPGDEFWIPGTNIIGAICVIPYTWDPALETEDPTVGKDYCILDDTHMHGTGTSSSVLSENPDALLVIAEGKTTAREAFATDAWPVDVISHSWGSAAPTPLPCSGRYSCTPWLFEVTASGNEGAFPVVLDGAKSNPSYLNIGAADAGSQSEPGISGFKTMDFVSEYCRPTAQTRSFDETRDQYCGTSFSAPTFAGALSRILYEIRAESGYTGSIVDGLVDPIAGVSMWDVRNAINHTATYNPEDKWNDPDDDVPLIAPWYQWGWGYFDSLLVPGALECIFDDICPERPAETVAYMEALWLYRNTVHTV